MAGDLAIAMEFLYTYGMTSTVLIADDHPLFRRGLRDLIEETDGFRVVAEAADGESAIRQLPVVNPDLAIVDLAMPGRDGFGVLSWVGENQPLCHVVIMTMYKEDGYLHKAAALGAQGFLVKDDADNELIRCLETVLAGDFFISPSIGSPSPEDPLGSRDSGSEEHVEQLTAQQREVLRELAQYRTSKEIARELGISPKTVENHRANIASLLELKGPNRLLQFAVRNRHLL